MDISVNPSGKHPLGGARERLKRADENIRYLDTAVSAFVSTLPKVRWDLKGDDIVFSDKDRKAFQELRKGILGGATIPRLSVLAGEIVHHFRSAFDHVIWQLSTEEGRRRAGSAIEFPVCESAPECVWREFDRKVKHSSFCRKVQGVFSITALARIDSLQPYKRTDRYNSPLLQIHILDKLDKHRELIDVTPQAAAFAAGQVLQPVRTVKDSASGGVRVLGPTGPPKMKVYAEMVPQVAFAKVGKWEPEPLIPYLQNLLRFSRDTVESFASEF